MHLHCGNVMLITLGVISFFSSLIITAVMFISQMRLCKEQFHETLSMWTGGGGLATLLSVPTPNEIDLPPSISVGTGTEEAHHAGTRSVAYNLMNELLVQMCPLCEG